MSQEEATNSNQQVNENGEINQHSQIENNQSPKVAWYTVIGFTALIAAATFFIRIPTGANGYFNFGDVAVVFTGLLLGKKIGFWAGGLGSAIADIIAGFMSFAPITFIAKGAEGFICGLAKSKQGLFYHLMPFLGTLLMVSIYFISEWLILPFAGFGGAVAELLPNIGQAIGGYVGGKFLYGIYNRISSENE